MDLKHYSFLDISAFSDAAVSSPKAVVMLLLNAGAVKEAKEQMSRLLHSVWQPLTVQEKNILPLQGDGSR